MMLAHDLYAETNPAFCAHILAKFCTGHQKKANTPAELAVCYLALPIVLSEDLNKTFEHTNGATGLSTWLDRSPEVRVGFAERVNLTLQFTTEAVRFGCFSKALHLDTEGLIYCGKLSTNKSKSPSIAQAELKAERLGQWFDSAGSSRAVMSLFGVTP
jgi:hypothetical protein